MIPLPKWAQSHLLDKNCPICGSNTLLENVSSVGIKEKSHSTDYKIGSTVLFFEYHCNICEENMMLISDPQNINISAEDMVINILSAIRSHSSIKNKVSKSKITKKELRDFKKNLASMNHDEFLGYIGAPKDSDKNNKKRRD